MTKKLLYLHQYFATPESSTGVRSYEISRALQRDGYQVTVLTLDAYLPQRLRSRALFYRFTLPETGVRVWAIRSTYSNHRSYLHRIATFLAYAIVSTLACLIGRWSLVYATSTPLTVGVAPLLTKGVKNFSFIFEVRDLWPEVPAALGVVRSKWLLRIAYWLEQSIYEAATVVIGLSPDMSAAVRNRNSRVTVHTIPNGSSSFETPTSDCEGPALRALRNLRQSGVPTLLYTGTVGAVNALHTLIPVLQYAASVRDPFHLVVVGDGRDLDRLLAHEAEFVHVFERVPKKCLPALLAESTAAVSTVDPSCPALFKNSANKVFDAFACGVPVVINHGGWIAELLASSGAGISVYDLAPQDAYASLSRLRDSTRIAGARAHDLGKTDYAWESLARQAVEVCRTASSRTASK